MRRGRKGVRLAFHILHSCRFSDQQLIQTPLGETEKKLARVFSMGQSSQAILIFDEADSLFGKRTQVKSSNDRHANTQSNVLLTLLEESDVSVILTSNHANNIDDAFMRRIRYKVHFPSPDAEQQAALWARLRPPRLAWEGGLDTQVLTEAFAGFTGGLIRNTMLRACVMLAMHDEEVLNQATLEAAAIGEATANGMTNNLARVRARRAREAEQAAREMRQDEERT